jgi:hypothetical protein
MIGRMGSNLNGSFRICAFVSSSGLEGVPMKDEEAVAVSLGRNVAVSPAVPSAG